MKKFGLIGYPLEHSFSKKYFSEKFEKANIVDSFYENYPLSSIDELPNLIKENSDLIGLNVTIPYKISVLAFLNEIDETAKQIGSVNTIKISPEKKLIGYNTDAWGFARSLIKNIKPNHTKALILGSGGASLAVQYVLKNIGIEFEIISRNPKENQHSYAEISKEIIKENLLIINCTPLGTYPDIKAFPEIPYEYIGNSHLLFDLVYNPAETEFLKRGKANGASIQNGYDMLKYQAEESWKIWNDLK